MYKLFKASYDMAKSVSKEEFITVLRLICNKQDNTDLENISSILRNFGLYIQVQEGGTFGKSLYKGLGESDIKNLSKWISVGNKENDIKILGMFADAKHATSSSKTNIRYKLSFSGKRLAFIVNSVHEAFYDEEHSDEELEEFNTIIKAFNHPTIKNIDDVYTFSESVEAYVFRPSNDYAVKSFTDKSDKIKMDTIEIITDGNDD